MHKNILTVVGITILFLGIVVTPMTLGYDVKSDRLEVTESQSSEGNGGLMDSAWPMYCHDVRHTGRSPYGKDGNFGVVKWKFKLPNADALITSSPAIDKNGTIYIGFIPDLSIDCFYAINSNGTKKWSYPCDFVQSSPAIAEDGTIYVGSNDRHFYAIFPNGTLKWRLKIGGGWVYSSPVIDENGIVYVASIENGIYAIYPNGTQKWNFKISGWVYDSPALDENGIVYIGSNDCHLYAIYKNNGTLKWKYKTGNWVGSVLTIGDDGIIYFGSNDAYLYALYPNGTLKWRFSVGWDALTSSPALSEDGNIYFGCHAGYIYCLDSDGNEKWRYPTDAEVSAPVSIDKNGIVYAGTWKYGTLYALNPDGTARWKFKTGDSIYCSPAIDENGTIYFGSWDGYLYALEIIDIDNEPPLKPTVDGPTRGIPRINYKFTAVATDPDGDNVSYFFDWGDGDESGWTDFVPSGTSIAKKHTWYDWDTYTVKVKAQDKYGADSQWTILEVNLPRNKVSYNPIYLRFIDRFPILREVLSFLLNH